MQQELLQLMNELIIKVENNNDNEKIIIKKPKTNSNKSFTITRKVTKKPEKVFEKGFTIKVKKEVKKDVEVEDEPFVPEKKSIEQYLTDYNKFVETANLAKKDYQYDGIKWCLEREINKDSMGGIIADEMGLGKTIMMIGLCKIHQVRRTLIVLPVVLINQWYVQIMKTTGIKPLLYYGPDKKQIDKEKLMKARIVIISYHSIQTKSKLIKLDGVSTRVPELSKSLIHQVEWDRVIFDEAHHMKNSQSQIFIGAKGLKTKLQWFVSATPVQNSLNDIISLLSLLLKKSVPKSDLQSLLKIYMLRRTKASVGMNLPPVKENVINVEWGEEKELAKDIHSSIPVLHVPGEKKDGINEYHTLLAKSAKNKAVIELIMRSRQACIYPKLTSEFVKKIYLTESDSVESTKDKVENYNNALNSNTKINSVIETIVERKDNGNSKIVFCDFKGEIDNVVNCLKEKGVDNVAIIDGRYSKKQRDEILQNKYDVLVLQIQTGCEGLNLQEYNEIYFVSPHWNPTIEDQAVARCHRLGQKKEVDVFRFNMEDIGTGMSLDSYIKQVQNSKRIIANETLDKNL